MKLPEDLEKMKLELNPKQRMFVEYMLTGMPGKEAAIKAGYSPKSAHNTQNNLLNENPKVKAYYHARRNQIERKVEETTELNCVYVLGELKEIIANRSNKTCDRLKGIELAGRYLGMWDRTEENTSKDTGYSTFTRVSELVRKMRN